MNIKVFSRGTASNPAFDIRLNLFFFFAPGQVLFYFNLLSFGLGSVGDILPAPVLLLRIVKDFLEMAPIPVSAFPGSRFWLLAQWKFTCSALGCDVVYFCLGCVGAPPLPPARPHLRPSRLYGRAQISHRNARLCNIVYIYKCRKYKQTDSSVRW